jgi:hypothetical protein
MKRPFESLILMLFLLILSLNALIGGGSMILSPADSLLQLNPEWIERTPFKSYLIPGIILFLFLGVLPAFAFAGLAIKSPEPKPCRINIFRNMRWGWALSLYSGIVTVIWITVQQLLTDYFILQPIINGLGILIIIFSLLPRVREYYKNNT